MKLEQLCVALVLTALTGLAAAENQPTEAAVKELAPDGTLRVAVAVGAARSAFWAAPDPESGAPRGVTVDLANALAQKLGVALQLVAFPNSKALADSAGSGAWSVAFMPADVTRAKVVDFSPPYFLFESGYLVRPGSRIRTAEQLDRPGVRIATIENTTTLRSAARSLKRASLVPFRSLDQVLAQMRSGKIDAVTLGRSSLEGLAAKLPGSRILDDGVHTFGIGLAVPKDHPAALAYVSDFIEEAKTSGLVQRALDAARIESGVIAPPVRR